MPKQPNIILIFTDNQQAATLGCYGNTEIHTPHLDALSARGVTFDNAFCPNGFCSPCRASVLTGKLPSQHGVHSWIDDRKSDEWPAAWHALDGLNTLPKALKSRGYATALVGKYHLGQPTSPAEGFDTWVTLEDGHVRSFYRNRIFDNGEVYDQKGHSVDFFTDKGVAFIEEQTAAETPFFLYLPYPAPYGHWPATKETDENRHTARYADCPMNSIPRRGLSKAAVDGFMLRSSDTSEHLDFSMLMRAPNDLGTLRNFYSQISMVDDGVGKIVETLDRLGIADDTLLIFTTDHGLSTGEHGFWGHGAATLPSNLHRAAHNIPMIMHQNGVTAEGLRSKLMVSGMDVFATILDHTGVARSDDSVPSRSLLPILTGSDLSDWGADAVFSEQEETRVIRTPKWAYFKRFETGKTRFIDELFDVEHDAGETVNLADDPAYAEIKTALDTQLTAFFRTYAEERADLWKGGVPIQHSERKALWVEAWGDSWKPVYSYDQS
ncbi:sulfatase-like hydrolase/transferase [uncultured Sulfitobacter sp.]|uniref:sulfatase family protein n=1 Tax=uncultured Sulfitobacter sp. TaxID=191468 RepID=UPI002603615A|nr:sulfatase-like hydrolase/transferase [uncultured Sulfitobacter sp.]